MEVWKYTHFCYKKNMAGKDLKSRQKEIEDLVLKAQDGDQEAFAKIYDIFVDPIYRYVFYRVKSGEAEDLVGTIFLKVWEHIRKYQSGQHSFSAWIFRIAHNLVIDHYRSVKDREFDDLDLNVPDMKREHNPIKMTESAMHQEVLKMALTKLKKPYQEILIHKFINDLSNPEIAQILRKSEGGLRILQFRALRALRQELQNMGVKFNF